MPRFGSVHMGSFWILINSNYSRLIHICGTHPETTCFNLYLFYVALRFAKRLQFCFHYLIHLIRSTILPSLLTLLTPSLPYSTSTPLQEMRMKSRHETLTVACTVGYTRHRPSSLPPSMTSHFHLTIAHYFENGQRRQYGSEQYAHFAAGTPSARVAHVGTELTAAPHIT